MRRNSLAALTIVAIGLCPRGLVMSGYDDTNVLAVSPDGRVLLVADRNASRIGCVEER